MPEKAVRNRCIVAYMRRHPEMTLREIACGFDVSHETIRQAGLRAGYGHPAHQGFPPRGRRRTCAVKGCTERAKRGRVNCLRHRNWRTGQEPGKPCRVLGCKGPDVAACKPSQLSGAPLYEDPAVIAVRVHARHDASCPCETVCGACGDALFSHEFGPCMHNHEIGEIGSGCQCREFRQ